ncbi:hypothetical protein X777_07604 [Ooceraea biroi]|uniref:Uncharacterized protein n=1 Tax=Ooceraea biroi TaxID=2015173 RepID=A0A026X3X1_OOCBI|nr:hypothetical protein X777_07604 [Ooceraea biroi]
MSLASISAFLPPSMARALTLLPSHLLISLYQFFTRELGATMIAFSMNALPCFNNVHNRVIHCNVLPRPISSAMIQPQSMHWARRDHAVVYVALRDVLQEPDPIIGTQVLRRQHVHGWVDLPVVQLTIDVDLALGDVPGKIGNRVSDVVVRHSENGDLRDGAVAALNSASALVDRSQVGVHVTWETTSTRHLFAGGRDLSQRFGIRGHVGEDDQHVLLALVRQELGRRQSETRRDDSLDRRVVGQIQEEAHVLHGAVLLEVLLEETSGLHVDTHRRKHDGEVVLVRVENRFSGHFHETCLTTDLRGDLWKRGKSSEILIRRNLTKISQRRIGLGSEI